MADKKSGGGFKTFILFLFIIVAGFFLCSGAFLMLSPNSSIFGISFASNKTNHDGITTVNNTLLRFGNFTTINIDTTSDGKGFASVEVNYGINNTKSEVLLIENSSGFFKGEAQKSYELEVSASGNTLNISLVEPEYNFVMLNNSTVLQININSTVESVTAIQNLNFNIETCNGNISFGGSANEKSPSTIKANTLIAETVNGNITINHADLTNLMDLTTTSKAININEIISANSVKLTTNSGKITAKELSGSVVIKSEKSHMVIGNIGGNLSLDAVSGTIDITEIGGNFIAGDRMNDSYLEFGNVGGNAIINRLGCNITVNIDSIGGETLIKVGDRGVIIGEVAGVTVIETKAGRINLTKASANNNSMTLTTTSGTINATLLSVLKTNSFTTSNAAIIINYPSGSDFVFESTTSNRIYVNDENKGTAVNEEIGDSPVNTANQIIARSTNGEIRLGY